MKHLFTVSFFLILFLHLSASGPGQLHVISHQRVKVLTDPSKGNNSYPLWSVFPSSKLDIRKITLYVTYQCPDSLHCGEWDYVDKVYLGRIKSKKNSPEQIELARVISPYGWRFGPGWKFTWHVDVTDFAFLLRDSVEIDFQHSGYESNKDRGWLVTLDFAITEGRPAMECLGIDTLWCRNFPYGDSLLPIDRYLNPHVFTAPQDARVARLRILQTGHGMEERENCAEFCSKWRKIFFDDVMIDKRQIWRTCGDNPLFPQAGTWLYNRANWCPGSIVYPDNYDYALEPGSKHQVRLEMQPYIRPKSESAKNCQYAVSACLFHLKQAWASNDVSLEEIIAPGTSDEYLRKNPVCASPEIRIRNNGRNTLTSLIIKYGITGRKLSEFHWTGSLPSQKYLDISLPGVLESTGGKQTFSAELMKPNNVKDEYPGDNILTSEAVMPPVYGSRFILVFRTNHDSTHCSWQIADANGVTVKERRAGLLRANTVYRDTVNLTPGCYLLRLTDTAGDGLDFWANPEGGYGFFRLIDMQGRLIRSFGSDFGSGISHWFTVKEGAGREFESAGLPLASLFPLRNKGKFEIEIFDNEPHSFKIQVFTADSSSLVTEKTLEAFKEGFVAFDISAEPDATYLVKIFEGGKCLRRRFKLKHQD